MDETNKVKEIIKKHKEKSKKQRPILDDGQYSKKIDPSDVKTDTNLSESQNGTSQNNKQKVFLLRHGERVDFSFGSWVPYSFDKNSQYVRKDLNMPRSLPKRRTGPIGFVLDTPLTIVGELQASLTGEAMKEANVQIDHIFCSPSLRCLQTCQHVLTALNDGQPSSLPMAIEPGLYEWMKWYQDKQPDFMTLKEMREAGFNIRDDYTPLITVEKLLSMKEESHEDMYTRNYEIMKYILEMTKEKGGNILVVGHATTLDVCSRQLLGGKPRTFECLFKILHKVPYCSMAMLEHDETEDKWAFNDLPIPPLTQSNIRFNWKILVEDEKATESNK